MSEACQRPLVGITGPDRGGTAAWWCTALAVYRAGGSPKRIRPEKRLPLDTLDALILGGGVDLDPSLYGGEQSDIAESIQKTTSTSRHPLVARFSLILIYLLRRLFSLKHPSSNDPARDAMEVILTREALAQKKPVLGICRGAQMLNAVLGGSLHREIRGFYTETPYIRSVLPRKKVFIMPGTVLASLWPLPDYRVNALHHQAVHQLAGGLIVSAREENGLIQAIEDPSRPFVLGVQWHPEFLPHMRHQQLMFVRLVRCALARRQSA